MDGPAFWTLAMCSAFCIGLARGGVPSAGVLAVPLLSLVISPVAAAGLLLPVLVLSDGFGLWAYRKHVNLAVLRLGLIGITAGTGLGWATAHLVSDQFVRGLVGVIGLAFSLNFLLRPKVETPARAPGRESSLIWTTLAGFTSFVAHSGAAPWQVWLLPQRLPKMMFAGTTAYAFAIMNLLKLPPYYMLGQLQAGNLQIALILLIPSVIGVVVAFRLIQILPTRVFYAIVTWMLLAVSIKLIWDGLTG